MTVKVQFKAALMRYLRTWSFCFIDKCLMVKNDSESHSAVYNVFSATF